MVGLGEADQNNHMMGYQAEVIVNGLENTEVYLGHDIAPGSFGWLVPLSESRGLVGLISRHRQNGHMGRFMSALLEQGKVKSVIEEPRRWGIPIKPLRRTFGNRVVVVGDAAGLVKPTTGGGIYYALLSGEMAAEAVHRGFRANDLSARGLKRYEAAWKAVFAKELRIGYYGRRLYEALADRHIEYLLNQLFADRAIDELMSSRGVRIRLAWRPDPQRRSAIGGWARSFGPSGR